MTSRILCPNARTWLRLPLGRSLSHGLLGACLTTAAACDGDPAEPTAAEKATTAVQSEINANLSELAAAAADLCKAAPAPDADGWNASADAAAVATMKVAWKRARQAYERSEGAIAVLFPDLDVVTDERYDGFVATEPDNNLFDGQVVTGVHAIERILWADSIPSTVVTFEMALPNYKAAAFPATLQEATDFRDGLCKRFVTDTATMASQFKAVRLDAATAWRGVTGSMAEQVEKLQLAATGEEESRYAQYTLADLRANVAAGLTARKHFSPWLRNQTGGAALDDAIAAKLTALQARYDALAGDALPPVPASWSSRNPSAADLATPFGQLFSAVAVEADAAAADSLVGQMDQAAALLGLDTLP